MAGAAAELPPVMLAVAALRFNVKGWSRLPETAHIHTHQCPSEQAPTIGNATFVTVSRMISSTACHTVESVQNLHALFQKAVCTSVRGMDA